MSSADPASPNKFPKWLDSMLDNGELFSEYLNKAKKEYEQSAEDFWSNLTPDQQLQAFYSVCKRIKKGELEDRGSYRYVLYDVFGFGFEAYAVGMDCGYLEIHNAITPPSKPTENHNESK